MGEIIATLNPNALGDGLGLDLGNLVVTTLRTNLDRNRKVLGTLPKAVGRAYIEAYFYSTFQGDLTGLCALGIAATNVPLNTSVGNDALSWAIRPDTGGIWNNSTEIESGSGPVVKERNCIGIYVNFDGIDSTGQPYVAWFVNGSQYASVLLPTGHFWVIAVSIGSTAQGAGDLSCFVNFGSRTMEAQPNETVTL